MKIILREDVETLGTAGETVNVKDGFARNYLIPKKMAYPATRSFSKVFEEEKKLKDNRDARATVQAEQTAAKLSNLSLEASVKVGEEDKVFGAVTAADIAALLADKGYEIDKRDILLEEPLKALGIYNIPVKVASEIKAEVKVWVIKE
ncbi:MAG: 50S ribosomal protein L9 [Candidatus Marinimicrobia bacterium]|nr:50S ribosomal protein L9 [Candidatus Neomarinimicrobiota bacterium]MCF7903512.1 50S ribosomal protein L9 [Candidatus Neomarinimicrobiota bacterium]